MEAPEGNSNNGEKKASMICLIPPELAPKLRELLERHFAEDPNIMVIVERRTGERRSGKERRKKDTGPVKGKEDRRKIRNADGRRVGERRAALVPATDPPELPRKAKKYAQVSEGTDRGKE